jgi:hypothetical protein
LSTLAVKRVVFIFAVFATFFAPASPASAAVTYRSVTYPATFQFSGVSVSTKGLGLYGTSTVAGNQGVACLEAHVNPTTLTLSDIFEPRCDDPRITGHGVVPVEATTERGNFISVRVARLDSATGRIQVGPVLGTDEDASDTRPLWAYGPGSLWLYLTAPKGSPNTGEVLRVSDVTGRLLQATPVAPDLYRPVLAANADGLYLSPAGNGSFQAGPTTENAAIFHVGIGATKTTVYYRWPTSQFTGFADWMGASGDQLWADICPRPSLKCLLAVFRGPSNQPAVLAPEPNLEGWAVGNPSGGLFSALAPRNEVSPVPVPTTIVRIGPSTGALHKLATIGLPAYWSFLGSDGNPGVALYGGALYVLGSSADSGSPSTLYRIPARAGP